LKKHKPTKKFAEFFSAHRHIINRIHESGYKAYFIGGCVRDSLNGIQPYDFDIATDANPENIYSIFENVRSTGIKYGTLTVYINDFSYQVTTFRKEGGYTDFRKPDEIMFTKNLYSDLLRRDFTINTLAFDGTYIYEYFNALADLNDGIIKTVGSADRRFKEDALRILRAVRFAAKYKFKIEEDTFLSMKKLSFLLKNISKERIYDELSKIIYSAEDIKILFDTNIAYFLFSNPQYINQEKLEGKAYLAKLASVFSNYPNLDMIKKELKDLRADNKTINTVLKVIEYKNHQTDELSLRKLLTKMKKHDVYVLMDFKNADSSVLDEIVYSGYISDINELDITGHDIMKLGYSTKDIKRIKEMLIDKVIFDITANRKDRLIKMIFEEYDNQIVKNG